MQPEVWDEIMGLGFPGLLERARTIRRQNEESSPLTAKQKAYYDSIEITLSAILRLLHRFAECAKAQPGEKTGKTAAGCSDAEAREIRVTGWNVLWNDIPKKRQDPHLLRAGTVTGN